MQFHAHLNVSALPILPFPSSLPFLLSLSPPPHQGNHEACTLCSPVQGPVEPYNFTQYKSRFHSVSLSSNTGNNRFYSFNNGITHFVVFSAEAYLYARSEVFLENQLAFLKADLAAVDRKVTPWVVALAHKDWTMGAEAFAAFNPILIAGNVDVLFCGHVQLVGNRPLPPASRRATRVI
jgi:hypothetical protein